MKFIPNNPKKSLKALLRNAPLRSEMDVFKANLVQLLDKIQIIETRPTDESEEHLKNDLRDFLRDTYYKDTNAINTKDKKDLVIHVDKTTNSAVAVIIEAKRPTNVLEMISAENPNKKALHELILYYLDERHQTQNFELKRLIITNINEWFVIDANEFDKHIYNNTQIKNLYKTYTNDHKNNPFFYQEIEKIISKLDIDMPCVYFNIKSYDTILRNNNKEDDKELIALYKLLSPEYLLKITDKNDSNSLNEQFYRELLHILGLEEAKTEGKIIIRRKTENRHAASLIEATMDALKTQDVLHHISNIADYGTNREDQYFNVALELCITWINRILFLKLLEGQLVSYHKSPQLNESELYKFLNTPTIPDFDELFKLFHKVLAVNIPDRDEKIKTKYSRVPYLNSSLFEISELEDKTIKINSLDNSLELEYAKGTILTPTRLGFGFLPTLNYLFSFLDAYDFASEGTEDVREDAKTIINASVLGKVFEKINGYKDGSVFTPAYITMYMCRETIRKAVIDKFKSFALANKLERLKLDTIEEIYEHIFRRISFEDANKIINSLKICDPAVGSGHFLVSALNEIIAIKAELGILMDENGKTLRGYEIEIIDDELDIRDENGEKVSYNFRNKESQRLQKTLFHEKQTIIENCLFGVDINPNSVKICRLRLWIELLKNAYYKSDQTYKVSENLIGLGELETLPNIDINIKCGNSLLSRFALDADLSKALKSIKYDIKTYRSYVNDYKNEKNRDVKRGLVQLINAIKSDFRTEIGKKDPKKLRLNKLGGELANLMTQTTLIELSEKEKKAKKDSQEKLENEINILAKEIEDIETNAIYRNAFEWRFEFPEVMNDNGDFEGFDVVVGNPPYIDLKGLNPSFVDFLFNNYETTENRINLYSIFIELGLKIIKNNGLLSFINPNSILMNSSYSKIRNLIIDNVSDIVKLPDNVFSKSNVKVETIIFSLCKNMKFEKINLLLYKNYEKIDFINSKLAITQTKEIWNKENLKFNLYLTKSTQSILNKISNISKPLIEIADFSLGITPYDKHKGHSKEQIKERLFHATKKINNEYKPIINGENIQRYFIDSTPKEYIRYGSWLGATRSEKFFTDPRIIVRQIVSGKPLRIYAGYTEKSLYFTQIGFAIIPKNPQSINPKFLTSLLNSNLLNFVHKYSYLDIEKELFQKILIENCKQLPIKIIPESDQKPFITLVDTIIDQKSKGEDSTTAEKEIDQLVYKLYDLTAEEVKLVEGE